MEFNFKDIILDSNIICLVETFRETTPELPKWLNHYEIIDSKATRRFQMGRASGGILLLMKKKIINFEEFISTPHYVGITFNHAKEKFLLITVYIPPKNESDGVVGELDGIIGEARDQHPGAKLIILGDFNARTGTLTEEDDLDENTWPERLSQDKTLNTRGQELMQVMNGHNMRITNGRVYGDKNGAFTYISRMGNSTIDLCFTDAYIPYSLITLTFDEYPHTIHAFGKLTIRTMNEEVTPKEPQYQPKWKAKNKDLFIQTLTNKLNAISTPTCTDFTTAIKQSAKQSQMRVRKGPGSEPWFDTECFLMRKDLNKKLRAVKKAEWRLGRDEYYNLRRDYKQLIKTKKKAYWEQVRKDVSTVEDPISFWKAVKRIRKNLTIPNEINQETWTKFYAEQNPDRGTQDYLFYDARHGDLDTYFSLEELNTVIRNLKNNKTPGPDEIPNEFYKNLDLECKVSLLNAINLAFTEEKIPLEWSVTYSTNI